MFNECFYQSSYTSTNSAYWTKITNDYDYSVNGRRRRRRILVKEINFVSDIYYDLMLLKVLGRTG